MFFRKENKQLEQLADLLAQGMEDLFKQRGNIQFTTPPEKVRKNIIEYESRMRADGMEKFNNEPTYVSAVNFYASEKDMEKNKPLGALIVYVEQTYLPKLMKMLQYPPVDDENEDAMLDSCGTLGNIIAGKFKSEISAAGFIELEMSHFITYRNNALAGILFSPGEYEMFMVNFVIDGQKRMVQEMTMGPIPKR